MTPPINNPSLWFIIPAHGRTAVTAACLRQLARTCDTLLEHGVDASAVVIADDENLDLARELGFGTIDRPNKPLGRKMNDGYELAGREGIDYVVPFGTDDVADPALFFDLPAEDVIRAHRLSAIVDETGTLLRRVKVTYEGGDGIRIIPTSMFKPFGYRPLDEYRNRAMDTSTTENLSRSRNVRKDLLFDYRDVHDLQICEFKSTGEQLNSYRAVADAFGYGAESTAPFAELAGFYPDVFLAEMQSVYGLVAA